MKNKKNNIKNQSKPRNAAPNGKYCVIVNGNWYTDSISEAELKSRLLYLFKEDSGSEVEVFKLVKQKVKIDIAVKLIK